MRVLARSDVERLLGMHEAIGLMRQVFIELSKGNAEVPARTMIDLHGGRDSILYMPGYLKRQDTLGVKIVSVFPDNPTKHGISTINATLLLNDCATGELIALMDGSYITAIRTGAVSALATDLLARKNSRRLGVFGAGTQARTQILGVMDVRHITDVIIYDKDIRSSSELINEMGKDFPLCSFTAASTPDVIPKAVDIIVTATTSNTPVFNGALLQPGTHINSIGSFKPTCREVDDETIRRAKIFVDSRFEALAEAGDLIIPIEAGLIARNAIRGDLAQLVTGTATGRESDDDITFFKAVGLAAEDLAAASYVSEKAAVASVGALV